MSEAASVPFSETKAPESPDRLHKGALRLIDISASTMANIGPAYSFYFSSLLSAAPPPDHVAATSDPSANPPVLPATPPLGKSRTPDHPP